MSKMAKLTLGGSPKSNVFIMSSFSILTIPVAKCFSESLNSLLLLLLDLLLLSLAFDESFLHLSISFIFFFISICFVEGEGLLLDA